MIEWIEKASTLEGCFVEIGLGIGNTTKILLEYAGDKEVIGVDPFEEANAPRSYTIPYSYDKFKANVGEHDNLKIVKENSLSKEAFDILKSKEIALAFIDGLQYFGAVLSDLNMVSHAKIIILDDFNRRSGVSQVPDAVEYFLKTNNYKLINLERWAILTR